MQSRLPLDAYLRRSYTFHAVAVDDGGWFVWFPDLPGCMTEADTFVEVGEMAEDAFRAWITHRYETGLEIPEPAIATGGVTNWPLSAGKAKAPVGAVS